MVGDIFLMIKGKELFIQGLLSFALAHIFYITAVLAESTFQFDLIVLALVLIYIFVFLKPIVRNSGKMGR